MTSLFGLAVLVALAFGSPAPYYKVHSTNAKHDVYVQGKYVGSDPDVRIRRELVRDMD